MSTMSRSKLPIFQWGETLKIANYLLNMVASKSVSTTPFEIWYGRMPSFENFHIWGRQAEARLSPEERKLNPRIKSYYFVGYSEKSEVLKFYCAQAHTRIKEIHNAKFF